jgi:DNA uptake protein ComE-like DNA-binding protein
VVLNVSLRAVILFIDKNGHFKGLEDLKKVSELDSAKIESKKDLLVF